uniref:Uncharacterized protein n=1 Tax=Lotus japonicus TaxID=34305 RepID=I3SWJ0_LOTJA|nr:unknown [Lotus japonicus]AFK44632.1 unknown [Lotus japonicus]
MTFGVVEKVAGSCIHVSKIILHWVATLQVIHVLENVRIIIGISIIITTSSGEIGLR